MNQDLSDFETRVLSTIGPNWTDLEDLTSDTRAAVDYLVLSDLVERRRESNEWLNQWRLTESGLDELTVESVFTPSLTVLNKFNRAAT